MRKAKTSKHFFLTNSIILLFVLFTNLYPQTDNVTNQSVTNYSKYLQIGFINETALYFHYPLGGLFHLKSGFDIGWNYDENKDGKGSTNSQYTFYPYIREDERTAENISNSYEINISSILFYELLNYDYARILIGLGPSLSYAYRKNVNNSSSITDTTNFIDNYESINKVWGVGPSVSLLITSHIYGRIYLLSEYSFVSNYSWNTDITNDSYTSKTNHIANNYSTSTQYHVESNGWKLRFSKVKIGIMIEL